MQDIASAARFAGNGGNAVFSCWKNTENMVHWKKIRIMGFCVLLRRIEKEKRHENLSCYRRSGVIGSNYIHYMFRKYDNEIRIINVDALTYAGNLENLKDIENRDNYTFVKANICDKEAIAKIFAENDIDRVVHFAAESHVDRSIRNPEVFVQTNVLGTAVMLNCAKNAWELPDGTL